MERRRRCLLLKIVFAILGIVSGVSICITFSSYKNVHAALWGALAAVFAFIVMELHIAHRKNVLDKRFSVESLRIIKLAGIICSAVAASSSLVYFILMGVHKEGYQLQGYAPAGIFALLALKWTLWMFFVGRRYERYLLEDEDSEKAHVAVAQPVFPQYDYTKEKAINT